MVRLKTVIYSLGIAVVASWPNVMAGEMGKNQVPRALLDFEEVSPSAAVAKWDARGHQPVSPEDCPVCEVGVQNGDMVVQMRHITDAEARRWQPQSVNFSTDMTAKNKVFKEPTYMMPMGDDWICAYSYGEFGNSCWVLSKTGKIKGLLTGHEVVSLQTSKGRYFVTTYDKESFVSKLSEVLHSAPPSMKEISQVENGFLRILASPDDETIYAMSAKNLIRWNMVERTSVNISFDSLFFTDLARDSYSACAFGGCYWIGGRGVVCCINPLAPDLSVHLYAIKDWRKHR